MKKKRIMSFLIAATMVFFGTIIVVIAIFAVLFRTSLVQKPLVLINQPHHRQEIEQGQSVNINAIVRAKRGINRVEMWVDGIMIAAQDSDRLNPVVLSETWQADEIGRHTIIVRSFTIHGIEGQGSVFVTVVEPQEGGEQYISYLVGEDETLQDIADASGASAEDIQGINPGLDTQALEEDDVVLIPGGSGFSGMDDDGPGGVFPEAEEPAPESAGDPPGSTGDMLRILELDWLTSYETLGTPLELQFEALSLQTGADYESLHCYIGMADSLPRWYPDVDDDPATDESFTSLGGGLWNIEAYLAGGNALVFPWTTTRPLPADINCVGVSGGGTDAVDLGRLEMALRPETWDNIPRYAISDGGEDTFTLQYRVSRLGGSPGFPIGIDFDMPVPYDLRLGFYELRWKYNESPEEPIDGFRIYLNDTLLWTEPADSRRSEVAPEWYHPPCGETYQFTVSAFRIAPDDPESLPSAPLVVENPDSPCEREIVIDFGTLETYDLGRDEDRRDVVGPAYGDFYVMDEVLSFDGTCRGSGYCIYVMLYDDSQYDVGNLISNYTGGNATVVVTVPEGEDLVYGFDIEDHDPGPSRDDPLCSGEQRVPWDRLDETLERGVFSDNTRCRLILGMHPTMGSPIGEEGEPLPQPLLWVEDVRYNEETENLEIRIKNRGRAAWSARDLVIETSPRSGDGARRNVLEDFVLFAGDTKLVVLPAFPSHEHPDNVCVTLDPDDLVPEEHHVYSERHPVCGRLPDLRITGVEFDAGTGQLMITVDNWDEDPLDGRTVRMQLDFSSGGASIIQQWDYISMDPYSTHVLTWPGFNSAERRRLEGGYTLTIDPYDHIAESDEGDNVFEVAGETKINLRLRRLLVPYYPVDNWVVGPLTNENLYFADAYVESADSVELIMRADEEFSITPHDSDDLIIIHTRLHDEAYRNGYDVDVSGDEVIKVYVGANMQANQGWYIETFYLGSGVIEFYPNDWLEAGLCEDGDYNDKRIVVTPDEERFEDQLWVTDFGVCRYAE